MIALLDAHVVLRALFALGRLSARASNLLQNPANVLIFSEASLAELLNKCGRGKLPVVGTSVEHLLEDIATFGVQFVPIQQADIVTAASMPHHHSDPFDRLLIAQAMRLTVPVLTADGMFAHYGIQTIW